MSASWGVAGCVDLLKEEEAERHPVRPRGFGGRLRVWGLGAPPCGRRSGPEGPPEGVPPCGGRPLEC